MSECAETLVWLDFAYDFGYLKQTEHLKLQIQAKQTITGLMKMINEVEKWSFKDKISEPEIPYLINTKAPKDFS